MFVCMHAMICLFQGDDVQLNCDTNISPDEEYYGIRWNRLAITKIIFSKDNKIESNIIFLCYLCSETAQRSPESSTTM